MQYEIHWSGIDYETMVLYSTMPLPKGKNPNHVLNWVRSELWDYILEQPYDPVDHWVFDYSERVIEAVSRTIPLSNFNYPEGHFYFKPAIGYHNLIQSHEIVAVVGLYPPHSTPFLVDGIGYAGTVANIRGA